MSARLGHLRLDVEDLGRAADFYTRAFGLSVHERASDDESHYAFLTDGTMHHRLVLRQARDPEPLPDATRLDHFAFEVESEAELLAFVERLRAMGCETDLQEAGIAWQCYFHDPEGTKLEVYCDRREAPDGRAYWRGIQSTLDEATLREAVQNG